MPDPKVELLKMSLVWFHPCDLLGRAGHELPLPELVDESMYAPAFMDAQNGQGTKGLAPPWGGPSLQHFWTGYLEKQNGKVDGHEAWQGIVPFRVDLGADSQSAIKLAKLDLREVDIRLVAEGFLYRHGVGFILTFDVKANGAALDQLIDQLVALRRTAAFKVDGQVLRVDDVAVRALSILCERATGAPLPAGALAPHPHTIVTPVRMRDVPEVDVVEHDATHRILAALAELQDVWRKVKLRKLDERARPDIKKSTNVPGRVLFATDRARVVWFPDLMVRRARPGEKLRKLSCYHRNLTIATLQTEALMAFVERVAALERTRPVPESVKDARRRAALLLWRLYQARQSYRTRSVVVQIDDDPRKPLIAEVLAKKGRTLDVQRGAG